jgi:hypothetical protein
MVVWKGWALLLCGRHKSDEPVGGQHAWIAHKLLQSGPQSSAQDRLGHTLYQ